MQKAKQLGRVRVVTPKRHNPGVHAKTKQSSNKHSKLYKKPYNKQGR